MYFSNKGSLRLFGLLLSTCFMVVVVDCRKHHLGLKDDARRLIHITTFGFYKGGTLEVTLHNFYIEPPLPGNVDTLEQPVGFTVDRTLNDGINPYSHNMESSCSVINSGSEDESFSSIRFFMDFKNRMAKIQWSRELQSHVKVYKSRKCVPLFSKTWPTNKRMPLGNSMTQRQKRNGTVAVEQDYYSDEYGAEMAEYESGLRMIPEEDQSMLSKNSNFQVLKAEQSSSLSPKVNQDSMDSGKQSLEPQVQADDLGKSDKSGYVKDDVPSIDPRKSQQQEDVNKKSEQRVPPLDSGNLLDNPIRASDSDNDEESSFVDPALESSSCDTQGSLPLNMTELPDGTVSYSLTFVVYIAGEDCEGLYNLYFHNCAKVQNSRVTLNMSIVEENQDDQEKNYLSAGQMPLPGILFCLSVLFFTAGCFWVVILKKSRRETGVSVFKIHYLMAALVFVKSLSLMFHSINYHFIQIVGTHVEGWAMLFYVTHLLKGALLFLTILLIGTGYAFVKHLLNDKEKKLFMVVIPLQVLANVAQIIIEESEEGEVVHTTWKVIFISVDLLCCGAILFPVVWSIRHLQEASQTDGKAAMNLRKLKLFRHFYIMVVCYIYFTRIIVQMLLRITVPFQYEWLDDMFREMTTFIFFVLTGYKFRPTANNPYLELAHDSDEEADMNTAITESGLTDGVSKRGFKPKKKTLKEIVLFDPNEEGSDDDEEVLLEKREASHDFD